MNISVIAIEPANFRLRVKMKLRTKVSKPPVILQLSALAIDRGWESRMRMNMGTDFQIALLGPDLT